MKKKVTCAIDIGTSTIRAIAVEKSDLGFSRVVAIGKAPSYGIRHGQIIEPKIASEAIGNALNELFHTLGEKPKKIILGIGGNTVRAEIGSGTTSITKADEEITKRDIANVMTLAEQTLDTKNKWILDATPISFKVDNADIEGTPLRIKGSELSVRALFVTASYKHIEDLVTLIEEKGLKVDSIIPTGIALADMILTEQQKYVGSLVLDIGSETTTAVVFENGNPVGIVCFPIGSNNITKDLALGLRIPLEDAEALKIGAPGAPVPTKRKYDEIVGARLKDIFETIDSYLKKIKRSGLLPAGVFLSGGGSRLPNIVDVARDNLRLPAKLAIIPSKEGKTPLKDTLWYGVYALATTSRVQKNSNHESDDDEEGLGGGFGSLFKNLFKQLRP